VSTSLLEARDVVKRFGRRTALDRVSVEVHAGETLALVGPNGAGKTTLLAILAGSLPPTGGEVAAGRERVGFVPQRAAVYGRLSPRENLELFARLEGLADPVAAAARVLDRAGLAEVAGEPCAALSVGQRQRVNVAVGLLGEPRVLLLDEPTAALDPRQRRRLFELVGEVRQRGGAVVFTTQNVEEVSLHADRLVLLAEGRVAFAGSVEAFLERAGGVREAFEDAFVRFVDAL
jgi:ABC-type multidrug transport system ATPase subunit